jgi:peptidoglycan/LPS O-acetylase OafA/YrhL
VRETAISNPPSSMSAVDISRSSSTTIKAIAATDVAVAAVATPVIQTVSSPQVAVTKSTRLPALDFTKGALVLIMVLYHWMNYFVEADGSIYKYLRFLTPSFILITGFLISHVYLSKTRSSGWKIAGRLLGRGFKLLAIVACLNLALNTIGIHGLTSRTSNLSPARVAMAYISGTTPVAFSVLVPIAYLLIASAVFLFILGRDRYVYQISSAVCLAVALVLDVKGIQSGYLQIFSIGTLGIAIGYISLTKLNSFVSHHATIVIAYVAYLCAITLLDVIFLLQIVGVCLSLAIIYWIGTAYSVSNPIGRTTVLLGQYSLFAYIAQIVILQVLRRSLRVEGDGLAIAVVAFLAALALTTISVEAVHRARAKVKVVNSLYTAVFG